MLGAALSVLLLAGGAAASARADSSEPPAAGEKKPPERRGPPVSALAPPEVLEELGPPVAQAGAWAEYRVRARGKREAKVRISIPSPLLDQGRYWLEIVAAGPKGVPFAARMLVRGNPARATDLERAVVYVPGLAPLELPLADLREEIGAQKPEKPAAPKVARGRNRRIHVTAGAFESEELRVTTRGRTTRLWRSREVPLWGLVWARGSGREVELTGYGREGAHSVFPGGSDERPPQGRGSESTK